MKQEWDKLGYVLAGKYRIQVIKCLYEKPMTPKAISKRTNLYISHVSNTIKELMKIDLVKCLTPNLKRGRIYSLTDVGKEVAKELSLFEE
jgi:DNA-binding MarR family transcriptional regulator